MKKKLAKEKETNEHFEIELHKIPYIVFAQKKAANKSWLFVNKKKYAGWTSRPTQMIQRYVKNWRNGTSVLNFNMLLHLCPAISTNNSRKVLA